MSIARSMALAAVLALGVSAPLQAEDVSPEQIVDALNTIGGKPQNVRIAHDKGVCAVGSFAAAPGANDISTAEMFSAASIPAMVRFSISGPNPKVSDKAKGAPRGLALSLDTKDGPTELVLISAPVFVVKSPEQFMGLLTSRMPDPATGKFDPDKIKAFDAANPEVTRQSEFLMNAPFPASYADATYYGVHTFFFINAEGKRRAARWLVSPVGAGATLSDDELKAKPDDFFIDELKARLPGKPVMFDFSLQFAEDGDALTDATVAWPAERKTLPVGRLTVGAIAEGDAKAACIGKMFVPTQLPAGIEPSDDPILQIRAAAYAISLSRRTQ
jgi:catalase